MAHAATALDAVYSQMTGVGTKVKDAATMSPQDRAQFDAFSKNFDSLRVKFGVPLNAAAAGGRGGGGGGGRGGGGDPQNVLARAGALKTGIMAFWEPPSDALVKQYNSVKVDLPRAVSDANAFLGRASAMSQTLKKYDITLTVPAPVK